MATGTDALNERKGSTVRRRWALHAPVIALHGVVTAILLRPAVVDFTTRPMVGGGDSSIFYWAWWNLERSVREGRSPLRTDGLFHPLGVDLSVTVTAPAIGLLSWPFRVLFGPEAQVNAVQLGAAFSAAVLVYFLLLRICRHQWIAALGGMAFAFTPYRFVHIGEHLNLIHTALLPGTFLLVLRTIDVPSGRRLAAVGAAIGFGVLVEPQLAAITAIGAAILLLRRWEGPRPSGRAMATTGGVALVVAAPVLVPLVVGIAGGASSEAASAEGITNFSSRLTQWVTPPISHPWWGSLVDSGPLWGPTEGIASPGLVVLGLALAGRRLVPAEQRRGWVWMTWAGVVLSLGPFVTLGEEFVRIPLPYLVLRELPFMDTMRAPGRFALLGVLALCVLAAQASVVVLERLGRRGVAGAALLTVVLAIELLPGPIAARDGGAPSPYEAIGADGGFGAVLELPLQWSNGTDLVGYPARNLSIFEAWATVHEHPMVGGSVSRYPADDQAEIAAIPVYEQVRVLQGDAGVEARPTFDVEDLRALDIGYVVYHRDLPLPAAFAYVDALDLPVLADDGEVLVWKVPPR